MPKVYTRVIAKGYSKVATTTYSKLILGIFLLIGIVAGAAIAINGGTWSASADHSVNHWDAQIVITGDSPGVPGLNSGLSTLIFGVHPDASAVGDVGLDQGIPPAPPQPNIVYYFSYPGNAGGFTQLYESRIGPADTLEWQLVVFGLVGAIPETTVNLEIAPNLGGIGNTSGPPADSQIFVDSVDPATGEFIENVGNFRDGTLNLTIDVPAFSFVVNKAFLIRVVEAAAETTARIVAPASGDEGQAILFDGSTSIPGEGLSIDTYLWNFGDGTTATFASGVHTYLDGTGDNYNVTLTVTDSAQGSDPATHTITINNVTPTVTAVGNQIADEGNVIDLDPIASFTDPGTDDTHTATIDWGDGIVEPGTVSEGAGAVAGSHSYLDDGAYTVTVTVTDDDGDTDQDTLIIAVGNAAPFVEAVADQGVNEGSLLALSPIANFIDSGDLDTHSATIDWGDGTIESGDLAAQRFFAASLDGAQEVPPVVTQATGTGRFVLNPEETELAFDITVDTASLTGPIVSAHFHNAAAGVNGGVVRAITNDFVGDTATGIWRADDAQPLSGAMVAELLAGNLYINIHTTDNPGGEIRGQIQPLAVPLLFGTVSGSHTYIDEGEGDVPYIVTITVTDNTGDIGTDTLLVTVNNVAPTVTAVGNQIADEGIVIGLDPIASFTDPGALDTHTATIDWGDGIVEPGTVSEGAGAVASSHSYLDDGGTDQDTLIIAVGNAAPTVLAVADQGVAEGSLLALSPIATFIDLGDLDTHSATIDWGDGTIESGVLAAQRFFAASLDGGQEVPSVVTQATGTGRFVLNPEQTELAFDITVDTASLTGPIVSAHFHNAAAGVNGGVVRAITNDFVGDTATGIWRADDAQPLSGAMVAELLAGNLYINIHTTDNPGGEIRGQIQPLAVSLLFGTVSGSHTYIDDRVTPYTVTITVTDNTGEIGTDTLLVTVNNVAPTVTAVGNQIADEGIVIGLDPIANFTDPGTDDTHTATIDWGDGIVEPGTVSEGAGAVAGSHSYLDDGAYTVTVTVTDDDGDTDQDTLIIAVGNAAPFVEAVADQGVNEGSLLALSPIANFIDSGDLDTHSATIDWGDGTIESGVLAAQRFFAASLDGGQEVPSVVTQATGTGRFVLNPEQTELAFDITVDTASLTGPIVSAHFHNAAAGVNGGVVRAITNDFVGDTATGIWRADDAQPLSGAMVAELLAGNLYINIHTTDNPGGEIRGQIQPLAVPLLFGTVSGSHTYIDEGEGDVPYIVTITVTDNTGDIGTDTLLVRVNNVAPVIATTGDKTVDEGSVLLLDPIATFLDAGVADTHTATIDWGDGSTPEVGSVRSDVNSGHGSFHAASSPA